MLLTAIFLAGNGICALFISGRKYGSSGDPLTLKRALALGVAGAFMVGLAVSSAYQSSQSWDANAYPSTYPEHLS